MNGNGVLTNAVAALPPPTIAEIVVHVVVGCAQTHNPQRATRNGRHGVVKL